MLLLAVAVMAACGSGPPTSGDADSSSDASERALARLERSRGATLGVVAIDTGSGRSLHYRAGTRFPFASTNKTFIAAAVLAESSATDLSEVVRYDESDLLEYAPITSRFVESGMTVRELLDAMFRFSDNTAANLLVERLGGTDAVEQWLRGIGDRRTSVDRLEPELNEALPDDLRDTSTPAQLATNLRKVVLGGALETPDRRLLRDLMLANTTGDGTIRAGVDPRWPVADKTGTAEYGVRNDIGVVYRTDGAPLVVVVLTRKAQPDATADDDLVAAATRVVVRALTRTR